MLGEHVHSICSPNMFDVKLRPNFKTFVDHGAAQFHAERLFDKSLKHVGFKKPLESSLRKMLGEHICLTYSPNILQFLSSTNLFVEHVGREIAYQHCGLFTFSTSLKRTPGIYCARSPIATESINARKMFSVGD